VDSKERRYDHVDGLRGLAALFVVLHHAWLTIWPFEYGRAPTGAARVTDVLAYGHFAVGVFIVVSGFCLMRPVVVTGSLPGGALAFFGRRARRILPPYYAAFALSLLLIAVAIGHDTGTHWDISVPVTPVGLIGNGLLLQDVVGGPQVNHVFWSIALECQIYLLFPLLVLVWRRRGMGPAVAVAAVVSAVLAFLVERYPLVGPFRLLGLTPQFVFLFALGAAAAQVAFGRRERVREQLPWTAIFAVAAAALVLACLLLGRDRTLADFAYLDPVAGLAAAALLVATTRARPSRLRRLLATPRLALLGTFAYSLYLIHAPVLQLVWQALIGPVAVPAWAAFSALLVVGVPSAIAAAYGFFFVCERPFLRPRRRYPSIVSGVSSAIEPSTTSASASASSSGG
jgi:peptidoglycan/LPS O-acetylase OafA/YrhL